RGLVDPVDENEVVEVGDTGAGDTGQAAELHEKAAVAIDNHHAALRLRQGDPQGEAGRAAHAPDVVEMEIGAAAQRVPVGDGAHPGDADAVVTLQSGEKLEGFHALHAVGAPTRATTGRRSSRLRW